MKSCILLPIVISLILTAAVAGEFHFGGKRIPRDNFVKRSKSNADSIHELVFAIHQNNLPALEEELLKRSTPGSPLYQQWLTFDEVGDFTNNEAGAVEVQAWLQRNNVHIVATTLRMEYIKASAKISVWEDLLKAEFHEFEDMSRKTKFEGTTRRIHRTDEYSIPSEVKPHLSTVFHTIQTPPELSRKYRTVESPAASNFRSDYTIRKVGRNSNKQVQSGGSVTVAFLNSYYQISNNTGSAAQQQAVFETASQYYSPTDLTRFQEIYELPIQDALHPFGFTTDNCVDNDCYEGNLDVQYIMGLSQQTMTVYWYTALTDTSDPFVDWITDVANTTNPPLSNSISWGSVEQGSSAGTLDSFNTEAMKLAAMGVTVVVASGDDGAAADTSLCNTLSGSGISQWPYTSSWSGRGYFPSFPASSPYVTALGATQGPESGDPEIACQSQESGVITTGGGFSTYYAQPSWQTDAVAQYFATLPTDQQPTDGYNPQGRAYPDVALIGVKYQVVIEDHLVSLYGTSASAPVFAAMISLINAARAGQNKTSVGFINPTLYAYGPGNTFGENGTEFNPYNDITSGSNFCTAYDGSVDPAVTCCDSGFYTAESWDPVTGFGSVFFPNLARMFDISANYTPPESGDSGKNGLSTVAIVGIVIGCLIAAAGLGFIIGFGIFLMCKSFCCPSSTPLAHAHAVPAHHAQQGTYSNPVASV